MRQLLRNREMRGASRGMSTPPLTSTDLSTTEPPTLERPARETSWQRRAREQQAAQAAGMNLLEQLNATLDGVRSTLLAPPMGDVLFSGTGQVGTDGTWRHTWPQAFASVAVFNPNPTALVVTGGAVTNSAPTLGAGVHRVPAYSWRTIALRGTELVVWGTKATTFDVEVYLRHREPGAGPYGVSDGWSLPKAQNLAKPAVGTMFTWSPGFEFKLVAVYFVVTTKASVGTRSFGLILLEPVATELTTLRDDLAATAFPHPLGPTITTYPFCSFAGNGSSFDNFGRNFAPLPVGPWPAGSSLASRANNTFGATDHIAHIHITYQTRIGD